MIVLLIILILLILIYIVRISNNNDLIKINSKTEEDQQIIKKEKKQQHLSKISIALSTLSLVILVVLLLADFTSIDYYIIDYFSVEFITESELNKLFYFIPAYIMIANLIYIQVNIGDFILKYFKTQEEEVKINIDKDKLLSLLYKKKPVTEEQKQSDK